MSALLINDEIYGNTPEDKEKKIINVINQASKSWIIPTDISVSHYGIGEPTIDVESGAYYLDVVSGNVYLGGAKWTLKRTLTSVQEELTNIHINLAWSEWVHATNDCYYRTKGDGLIQLRIDLKFDTSTTKSIVAYTDNDLGIALPSEIVPKEHSFFTSARWLGTNNRYYSGMMYCSSATGNLTLVANNADSIYAATGNVFYYI